LIATEDPELAGLKARSDFFSASMFRDLVMHVQEHQFTLPQIDTMLRRNGLKFLGFSSPTAHAALLDMPPKMAQRRARDLTFWDRFERKNPEAFLGMYQFVCLKR